MPASSLLSTFPADGALEATAEQASGAGPQTSKHELLEHLNKLPYGARVNAVSRWANTNRENAGAVVAALLEDVPSDAPVELAIDEEMSNLFPPQKTTVSSKFHEHQLGVFAAAASKNKAAVTEAATSASRLMKKLAVKESTRLCTDEEIVAMMQAALPKDRREFVKQLLRFRKHALLETVFDELRTTDGDAMAARCLHGLSSTALAPHLRSLFDHKALLWPKLWRFHEATLLEMLQNDLVAAHPLARRAVWSKWTPKFETIYERNHGMWRALLKMFIEHRPFRLNDNDKAHFVKMTALSEELALDENDSRVTPELPSWVKTIALAASLRDPATKAAGAPCAYLLQLLSSSFEMPDAATEAVRMLQTSVANDVVGVLIAKCDARKAPLPLDQLLSLCSAILERAPSEFSFLRPSHGNTRSGAGGAGIKQGLQHPPWCAAAFAAFEFALRTLQRLLGRNAVHEAADVVRVVDVTAAHYGKLQPTPGLLGLNLDVLSPALLQSVAPASAIESKIDVWLSKGEEFFQQAQVELQQRIIRAIEKGKPADDPSLVSVSQMLEQLLERQRAAYEVAAALAGSEVEGYCRVWPELSGYAQKAWQRLERWLASKSIGAVGSPCPHAAHVDDAEQRKAFIKWEATTALNGIWQGASTAVAREKLLPRMALPATLAEAVSSTAPYQFTDEVTTSLKLLATFRWAEYDEGLRSDGVRILAAFTELFFALSPSCELAAEEQASWEGFEHWSCARKPIGEAVLAILNASTLVRNAGQRAPGARPVITTAPGARTVASDALVRECFEAYVRVIKLPKPGLRVQHAVATPAIEHDEAAYLSLLKLMPLSLLQSRFSAGTQDLADLLRYFRTQAEVDKAHERGVVQAITRLPLGVREEVIKACLVPGGALDCLSSQSQESLHPYADLTDKDMRKALYKATDSSNPSRRTTALQTLAACAFRSKSADVLTATVAFIAKRIQNETAPNRELVCQKLLQEPHTVCGVMLSEERLAQSALATGDAAGAGDAAEEKHTAAWLRIVDDFIQAPDSEVYSSLVRHLSSFAKSLVQYATTSCSCKGVYDGFLVSALTPVQKTWVDLGTEILWRLECFSQGTKKASLEWTAGLDSYSRRNVARSTKDVDVGALTSNIEFLHGLYTAHAATQATTAGLSEAEPPANAKDVEDMVDDDDAMEDGATALLQSSNGAICRALSRELGHYGNLARLVGKLYVHVPMLVAALERAVVLAEDGRTVAISGKFPEKDGRLPPIHQFVAQLVKAHTKQDPWQASPALCRYYEAQLRRYGTSQDVSGEGADAFLNQWLSIHLPPKQSQADSNKPGFVRVTRRERQQKRASAVAKLLAMDKSAVHVKLVWRYLMRHRQDLLGESLLNPTDDIAGIFKPLDTPARRASYAMDEGDESDEDVEPFLLPATYGLRRLLQPQAATLARRWRAMALDQEISSTERSKAVARYCSSPAVAFTDIVDTLSSLFGEQNAQLELARAATEDAKAAAAAVTAAEVTDDRAAMRAAIEAGKLARAAKSAAEKEAQVVLPLSVSEGLLEGMMRGDEPSAPFGFLLSPQLLARTEARVTMSVIERAVGMIPSEQIVNFASVLLGNRAVRRAMKVTVHKALLRLLRHGSAEQAPALVLREWRRPELHRDVRVAILQTALELLHRVAAQDGDDMATAAGHVASEDALMKDVWAVLESAAADKGLDPYVKAVLLAPDARACETSALSGGSSCGKLEEQVQMGHEAQKERLPAGGSCEQRYYERVLCAIDATEAAVAEEQRALAVAAADKVAAAKAAAPGTLDKSALTRAATELKAANDRSRAADDLRSLFLLLLPSWAYGPPAPGSSVDSGTSVERIGALAARLMAAVLDESASFLELDQAECTARNQTLLTYLPQCFVKLCLHAPTTIRDSEGNPGGYDGAAEVKLLERTVQTLAAKIVTVPFAERSLRHAVFARLTALHEQIPLWKRKSSATRAVGEEGEEILRGALQEMDWLAQESAQMAKLSSKRLPPVSEERLSKRNRFKRTDPDGW